LKLQSNFSHWQGLHVAGAKMNRAKCFVIVTFSILRNS